MATPTEIDTVDYAVLRCIHENGGCWKKRVHQWITDNIDSLPMAEPKSVQTIGRRIDDLHEDGLLETCIMAPDAVNRDMIIGYAMTDAGEAALQAKRDEFLREMVVQSSKELLTADDYDGVTQIAADREPLIDLMADAFDIDEETRETVLPELDTDELVGLLATHFFLDNADATFNPEHEDAIVTLLERTPEFRRPFEKQTLISRVRERIAATVATGQETARRALN